jgi:probable rRNA maturation factor
MTNQPATQNEFHSDFEIALVNEQSRHSVDERQLCEAVRAVLQDSELTSARVSIAVVDDPTIHSLNRQYLEHDWPTDVLSFVLEHDDAHMEGEIILSADTAEIAAAEAGWSAAAEQLLYAIHGTLHLVGYRDKTVAEGREMRAAEEKYLRQFGYEPAIATEAVGERSVSADDSRRGGTPAR